MLSNPLKSDLLHRLADLKQQGLEKHELVIDSPQRAVKAFLLARGDMT